MSLKNLCRHFSLHSSPFERAVSETALLRHKSFAEAHSRLLFGLESKTPAVLTAEPGLGKSTLLAVLDASLDKGKTRLVYCALSSCRPFGLISQLASHYGVEPRRACSLTAKILLDELCRSGKTEVLVLDEAHRLPPASLDELRLLSNSDFDRTPPFWLLLVGQPPLRERLLEAQHASLWQRLAVRTSLSPLSDVEVADYLERRLRAAGAQAMLFKTAAVDKLFELTRGVPRLINNLANAALLTAATAGKKHVDLNDVESAGFDMEHV
jgi:type II secretory pathway predicted ATPase ExeA